MKLITTLLLICLSIFIGNSCISAQVSIGDQSVPDTDAILDLTNGNSLGLLLPHAASNPNSGSLSAAPEGLLIYYKENFFWHPERNGFCEQFVPKNYKWTEADYATGKQFDKFIGIYWNDDRNGYGIKYYKGKVVEKGIYQGGQFVKSEDFDLELMQKTFKKWY